MCRQCIDDVAPDPLFKRIQPRWRLGPPLPGDDGHDRERGRRLTATRHGCGLRSDCFARETKDLLIAILAWNQGLQKSAPRSIDNELSMIVGTRLLAISAFRARSRSVPLRALATLARSASVVATRICGT